jgi:hypothetical protein
MLNKQLLIHAVIEGKENGHHGICVIGVVAKNMRHLSAIVQFLGWTERYAEGAYEDKKGDDDMQYMMSLRKDAASRSGRARHSRITFRTMQIMDA